MSIEVAQEKFLLSLLAVQVAKFLKFLQTIDTVIQQNSDNRTQFSKGNRFVEAINIIQSEISVLNASYLLSSFSVWFLNFSNCSASILAISPFVAC